MESSKTRVYVSYSWDVEDNTKIVEKLVSLCKNEARGIELILDRKKMKHGDLISQFMDKLIASDHIITVFSKAYLESEYCMTELLQIYNRGDLHTRIHPVIADDMVLSDFDTQLQFINYWKEVDKSTGEKLKGLDPRDSSDLIERHSIYRDISQKINKLMSFAGDMLVTPLEKLEEERFDPLLDRIRVIKDQGRVDESQESDQEYLEKIIKSIAADIKKSSIFKDKIISEMDVTADDLKDLTKYLVDLCKEGEVLTVIQGLQAALRESIDFMDESATPVATVRRELKVACSLLSKLVLFSVRDEWMQQHLENIAAQGHADFQIPKMDLRHIGIITDRQYQILPELSSEIKKERDVDGVLLESGIEDGKSNKAVRDALKQLYCIVFKGVPAADLMADDFATEDCEKIKHLRATIKHRQKHKNWKLRKNYFMAVTSGKDARSLDIASQRAVAKLIPELQWVVLKSQDTEQVLMVPDIELKTAIDEFFRTLGE